MRRNAISSAVQEEEAEINMTPMLDVVFIMLIFFIVTANFIKEPGLEINRPESDTSETQENAVQHFLPPAFFCLIARNLPPSGIVLQQEH